MVRKYSQNKLVLYNFHKSWTEASIAYMSHAAKYPPAGKNRLSDRALIQSILNTYIYLQ